MSWRIEPARTGFPAATGAWDECNARLFGSHPLLDARFVGPLVACFAGEGVLLAREEGGASLLLLERARRGVWRTFLPSQAQIAPALLGPGADLAGLFRALPGPAAWLELLCQDPEYSHASGGETLDHAVTMRVDVEGSFDAYWSGRSRQLRKNIRRSLRKMEEAGLAPRLVAWTAPDDVAAALQRYGELESRGWKADDGTAIHPDNAQGEFYARVLRGFAAAGGATAYEMRLGDRLAAARLTIANRAMRVLLKTSYDEELAEYSPGRVMLHLLLQRQFEEGAPGRVEFYTNATPEMLSWSTAERVVRHVTMYRSGWIRRLVRAGRQVSGWVRRRASA